MAQFGKQQQGNGSYREHKNGRMRTMLKLPDAVYDTIMFTLPYALNFSIIKCKSK